METTFEKQNLKTLFFGLISNIISLKNLIILFLMCFSFPITAQVDVNNSNSADLMEVKEFLSDLRNKELLQNATYSRAQNLDNLIYKIQPSVYYYSGTINTYGEKPKHLFTDISSLNNLNNSGILKNNIEIVTLRIENTTDLNGVIDLTAFESFKNLKYIYVLSNIDTTAQHINSMLQNENEKYSIFYSIQLGDHNEQ